MIRQAYRGLFELAAPMLFDNYLDFIDVCAGIREDEREAIFLEDTGLNTQIGGRLQRLAGMLRKGAFMLTYGDGSAMSTCKSFLLFINR